MATGNCYADICDREREREATRRDLAERYGLEDADLSLEELEEQARLMARSDRLEE